jgi:hypothetical protein
MKFAYFVGGCLIAIAFSNSLKVAARIFADLNLFCLIVFGALIAIGLGWAVLSEDTEKALTQWFIGVCAIGLGVMIGAV